MSLWVPPRVMTGMVEERRQHAADLASQIGTLGEWNEVLKSIDPYLQMVRAAPNAHHPALRPGYYHIIRTPPAQEGQPMIRVIEDKATGAFREPNSQDLEDLRAGDMWNDRAMRDQTRRNQKLQEAAERKRAQERHDRIEEVMDKYRHRYVTKISVPRAVS